MSQDTVIVFGGTGAIGSAICRHFVASGWKVVAVGRTRPTQGTDGVSWLTYDPEIGRADEAFAQLPHPVGAAVWAQGRNLNDDIYSLDFEAHRDLYRANVFYILETMQALLNGDKLAKPARFCIISSIWQAIARQNKLSYCVTKAALHGLVQSAAIDLGRDGHLINAVLPGALDTPMTRANLSAEQIGRLEGETPTGRLPTLDDVCRTTSFLCSSDNAGITGQFIAVDGGFSYARKL